ncbi:protein FAM221B-like isoform X3 [Polypterus senegalus]|uniref:protein FAM221B-like isoform X3 n=1 Tax=Polypterus senegalus TaxID=55291 RepID=UPI0019648A20|nr:protein FAM221B-like isoform X3 [Polypterus senegalus]
MDRKKKCATSVKSFSGDDSGNTSDTKCQDRRKTGVVDSKSAAERTARISDAQKVSEAAGTSYISESRASAAKIQGPRRDFPKICTTTGSRGNPGKRTPATDAAKPKDLQVAPARAASLSPLCRGYTINPIVPSSRGDVISVAQAMHREKFGERVKELFDPEREAALKAIQTGVYIGWRCPEFTWDCFRVGDGSKCFCGHLLKEHKNYTGSSVHVPCAVQSCRCKAFAFIASRPEDVGEFWLRKRPGFDPDTWRAMCKCKHSHEEHDASFSHICKKKGCRCVSFESSFLCASCDRHWEQHETFFDTETSRKQSGLPYGEDFLPFAEMPRLRNAVLTGKEHDDSMFKAITGNAE